MSVQYPIAEEAESEIGALKHRGIESAWPRPTVEALFQTFDRWLQHPRLLDPKDDSLLRVTVLNELTWMISDPIIGDQVWEYIRQITKKLGKEDPHDLREAWIIAAFETFAEPPECPDFLEKLFSLAGDQDTRWALFGAYDNVPWRLRPHAHKYSHGMVSDRDCDQWLIDSDRGDDEVLMHRSQGEQGGAGQPATRSELDSEGSYKPQPESDGRSR